MVLFGVTYCVVYVIALAAEGWRQKHTHVSHRQDQIDSLFIYCEWSVMVVVDGDVAISVNVFIPFFMCCAKTAASLRGKWQRKALPGGMWYTIFNCVQCRCISLFTCTSPICGSGMKSMPLLASSTVRPLRMYACTTLSKGINRRRRQAGMANQ